MATTGATVWAIIRICPDTLCVIIEGETANRKQTHGRTHMRRAKFESPSFNWEFQTAKKHFVTLIGVYRI